MLDVFFAVLAAGLNSADSPSAAQLTQAAPAEQVAQAAPTVTPAQPTAPATVQIAPGSVVIGNNTVIEGTSTAAAPTPAPAPQTPAAQPFNMAVVPAGLVAEPQTPTGKFTTAQEVRPILQATKGNWIAVREYDGKDLLYVTHLWGWRCGLAAMAISVNDEPMQNWPLPPCHMQYATPNAILEDDGLPYLSLRLQAVQKVTIQIVYDDLTMDMATFARGNVLIP